MLLLSQILGDRHEARFAGRRVEYVDVAWDEASKRRLRRHTDAGTDVAIDLPRGRYLADGAVLHDDGQRVVAVRRRAAPALVVEFDLSAPPEQLVDQALRLGHAFGNQHVPVEIVNGAACVPLTTSESVARATVNALALRAARVGVAPVALGRTRPLSAGHGQEPPRRHGGGHGAAG